MAGNNTNLINAKKAKNDEFYTMYEDVEAELMNYKEYFKDKVIYLPCDTADSAFWQFFMNHAADLGVKKVIATHYDENSKAYKLWLENYRIDGEFLQMDGDFRSDECIEILKECDIVCTNPPFSLFREFMDWIISHDRQFLIIGSQNAFTYKEIFPLFKEGKIWTGYNKVKQFIQPDGTTKKFGNICWFTNLPVNKDDEIPLTKTYNPKDYPKYDNYNAIEVGRVVNIPKDYDGVMGVPITFLDKYHPQFVILGHTASCDISPEVEELREDSNFRNRGRINGKEKYDRVLIKRNEAKANE